MRFYCADIHVNTQCARPLNESEAPGSLSATKRVPFTINKINCRGHIIPVWTGIRSLHYCSNLVACLCPCDDDDRRDLIDGSSNFKIRPSNHIGADKVEEEAENKDKTHLPRIVHHQARHQPGESLYNQSHYILMIQIEYILPGEMRLVKRFPSTTSSFVFFALASVLCCGLRSNSLSRPLHDSLRDLAPPPRGAEGITFNFTLSILSLYHYNKMENSPRQ